MAHSNGSEVAVQEMEDADMECTDTDASAECIPEDVNVCTGHEDFLAKVHTRFLQTVQPRESGLLDELRAEGVISSDEENEVVAEVTRRDKARKLWELLHRVPPTLFRDNCLPALRTRYPHVVQGTELRCEGPEPDRGECFRHIAMQRMSVRRFADVFPSTKSCTLLEYRNITGGGGSEMGKWEQVFGICQRNWDNEEFTVQLSETMLAVGIGLPRDLSVFLSTGFPCCCKDGLPSSPQNTDVSHMRRKLRPSDFKRKTSFELYPDGLFLPPPKRTVSPRWIQRSTADLSSCGYPCTVDSMANEESVSLSSRESTDVAGDRKEETRFNTKAQKDTFLQQMEIVNKAINKACSIRPLSRELSGLKEELSILQEDDQTMTGVSYFEEGSLHRLCNRAEDAYQALITNFQEALHLKTDLELQGNSFHPELPFKWKKILLSRRQMLENEMKEAESFSKQSQSLYRSVVVPTRKAATFGFIGNPECTAHRESDNLGANRQGGDVSPEHLGTTVDNGQDSDVKVPEEVDKNPGSPDSGNASCNTEKGSLTEQQPGSPMETEHLPKNDRTPGYTWPPIESSTSKTRISQKNALRFLENYISSSHDKEPSSETRVSTSSPDINLVGCTPQMASFALHALTKPYQTQSLNASCAPGASRVDICGCSKKLFHSSGSLGPRLPLLNRVGSMHFGFPNHSVESSPPRATICRIPQRAHTYPG